MKFKLLVLGAILILVIAYFFLPKPKPLPKKEVLAKFSSEEDFKAYLQEGMVTLPVVTDGVALGTMAAVTAGVEAAAREAVGVAERVSPTTVQVRGIDEPDLVKTDGARIYFSPRTRLYIEARIIDREIWIPEVKTRVIRAFPPEELSSLAEINETGDLFLTQNTLLILARDNIYGYDVSNPASPSKKFEVELNGSIVGARLYEGKVYLVLRDGIDYYKPCPLYPLAVNGKQFSIPCQEIYHPVRIVPVDVTYTALILNPETGEVERSLSFVGSSSLSIVYMSPQAIYITYTYQEDMFQIMSTFIEERCKDLFPQRVIDRLKEIQGYNISAMSKMMELQIILTRWMESLDPKERMNLTTEFGNRFQKYLEERVRDLVRTGLIKIGLEEFAVLATGDVPGMPLNQFSLDEYEGYLRIATTIGMWTRETQNDVYVLNEDLKIVGSVKGLGIEERIFSVRFLRDRGYVVTFRIVDPFYVLDLSDPTKPELKGELKIPGYSSYLHPIEEYLILGVGKEGWQVKISLFDVSSAEEPKEIAKYLLNESWSDVLETHHAFLLDKKHGIFFLPGRRAGYIFSYSSNKLELVKTIPAYGARRAIYLDDWLYIIADTKIVVLNELTWEIVNELELTLA
jgi:uncharacterized secreted protein with C-terminal beta-propeller domain